MAQEDAAQEAEGEAAWAAQCEAEEQARLAFEEMERQGPKIILYSTIDCPRCQQLNAYLGDHQIPYQVMDLTNPAILTELRLEGEFSRSAPILQIGAKYYQAGWLFTGARLETAKLGAVLQ